MTKADALGSVHSNSMVSPSEVAVFYRELDKLPDKGRMLEIGTGFGHSTAFFAIAKPEWTIYTVDCYGSVGELPNVYSNPGHWVDGVGVLAVIHYLEKHEVNNVIQIVGDSAKIPWELKIDALFIDGDHEYSCVKRDFERFSPFVKEGGVVLFHDIVFPGVEKFTGELGVEKFVTVGVWRK